ncbi:MAG: DUF4097 domain-containing protein [Acidobacteriota bacterium]
MILHRSGGWPGVRSWIGLSGPLGWVLLATLVSGCSLTIEGAEPPRQATEKVVQRSFVAQKGMRIEIGNLVGKIRVQGAGGGSEVEVEGTIHAAADTEAEAESLADTLELAFNEEPGRLLIKARYPVDRHDLYYYSRESVPGLVRLFGGRRSSMRYMGKRVTVVGRPRAGAVSLYVDIQVKVPEGVAIRVDNGVGLIEAADIRSALSAASRSGDISANSCAGDFKLKTLSGDIVISDHQGDLQVDTGSGDIDVVSVRGSTSANTGSGDVTINDMEGESLTADTGSGDISLAGVKSSILADTGSGDVRGTDLRVGPRLACDTGSGDVHLSGDLSGVMELELETGSGNVELELLAKVPSMHLLLFTSSGDIEVDIPGLQVVSRERRRLEAKIGEQGAQAKVKTGSGDIRVRARSSTE